MSFYGKIENVKADLHPTNYRLVVFQDLNSQTSFLIKSTAESKETIKWQDGQTYPLIKLHVTSASHPFYTGQEKMIDIEGRVDKYKNRQKNAQVAAAQRLAKTSKAIKQQEARKTKQPAANKLTIATKKKIPKANAPKPVSKKPTQTKNKTQNLKQTQT